MDTCGLQFRSKDATTTNLTDSSIVSTGGGTASYGGPNYILTNLQQLNTMLTAAMDAADALAKLLFDQTAGQGSGLGGEFSMTAFLKYFTYKALKQRTVNDSKTTFPTNTTPAHCNSR